MSQVIADLFFKERSRFRTDVEPPGRAGPVEREPNSKGSARPTAATLKSSSIL